MATMLRATTRSGLLSGQFRHGGIHVRDGVWTEIDADDPKVRATLLEFTPSHVRLAHGQEAAVQAAGLRFEGGRLFDARAEKAKADSKSKPAK